MEEYHIDCHLLSKLNAMAVFHCIVLSYTVIMIININVRASLFNIKVNAIANCHVVSWCHALSHQHIIGRSSTFHFHLDETYNSSSLLFSTMFSKVLQLI
jgi:hypothetical protein